MIRATLADIARWTNGTFPDRAAGRRRVTGISVDTRMIRRGQLFVALEAERDGHDFLSAAFARGASGALVRAGHPALERLPAVLHSRLVPVVDTGKALLALGAAVRRRLRARVIAITGSCGKTTTKEILAHLLAGFGKTAASPKSFNNAIGVPLTLCLADERTRFLVAEIGTNAPGEIDQLARIVRPDIGIVTMVGAVHLEGLKTLAGVRKEKYGLWGALATGGTAVWNADQASLGGVRRRWKGKAVSFGLDPARSPRLLADRLVPHRGGYRFRAAGADAAIRFAGRHNVANALAAMAVVQGLGLPLEKAARRLRSVPVPPGRLHWRESRGVRILDDSYNANPESVRAALDVLASAVSFEGRRIAVLGDMLELGSRAAAAHRAVGRFVARLGIDLFWGVGPEMKNAVREARRNGVSPGRAKWISDADHAAGRIPRLLASGDRVLVKGSRGMRMEKVVEAIARPEK